MAHARNTLKRMILTTEGLGTPQPWLARPKKYYRYRYRVYEITQISL